MRKLWYCLFYGLCAFTIAFSLYWMASAPPARSGPSVQPAPSASSQPSARAGAPAPGVPESAGGGYYLCDEGGRLAVYRCTDDGTPRERLALTDIYVNLLPEADAVRYKSGYYVWTRQELDTLLEDLGA